MYHFIMILGNCNGIPFLLSGKYLHPFHEISFTENPYSKMLLTRTFFFICQPILKIFATPLILRQTKCSFKPGFHGQFLFDEEYL